MEDTAPVLLLKAGAAAATGLAVAAAGLALASDWFAPPPKDEKDFGGDRHARLRAGSLAFRLTEPLLKKLAGRLRRTTPPAQLQKLGHDLKTSGIVLPWTPEEYLASVLVTALGVGLAVFAVATLATGSFIGGALLGLFLGWLAHLLFAAEPAKLALRRRRQLKERLPFTIDLMALLLESGATFAESLTAAAEENKGHAVGAAFGDVLSETKLGKTRRDALLALKLRVPELDEFAVAVIRGEEFGTPLSQILRTQADQARLKGSQDQERESAEAQVAIVFPGILIMVACMLIIIAPFVLQARYSDGGIGALFRN